MTENVAIIKKFIEAWSNLDADELVNYFSVDGVYYNMPTNLFKDMINLNLL
jgi:limonene-1,2-epoxide hydrolase